MFTSTPSEGVSRQEFEQLKNDLHYWQNTTLSLMKDRAGELKIKLELVTNINMNFYKNLTIVLQMNISIDVLWKN